MKHYLTINDNIYNIDEISYYKTSTSPLSTITLYGGCDATILVFNNQKHTIKIDDFEINMKIGDIYFDGNDKYIIFGEEI